MSLNSGLLEPGPSGPPEDTRCPTCRSLGICPHKMRAFLELVEAYAAKGHAMAMTPDEKSELATLRANP